MIGTGVALEVVVMDDVDVLEAVVQEDADLEAVASNIFFIFKIYFFRQRRSRSGSDRRSPSVDDEKRSRSPVKRSRSATPDRRSNSPMKSHSRSPSDVRNGNGHHRSRSPGNKDSRSPSHSPMGSRDGSASPAWRVK